jgi:hypothetical protein
MTNNNDLAILSGNFIGIENAGFQFIEIKNAFQNDILNINPFLWDKIGIRHYLPMTTNIILGKMNKINDSQFVIYGGKNLKPGTEIYLLRGTYQEFLNQTFESWNGNQWIRTTDLQQLGAVVVNNNRIIGPNYFCEFQFIDQEYVFYGISMDLDNNYILNRYRSMDMTGPFDIDPDFTYIFPNWINMRSNELDCYDLRSHPGLAKCLNVKSVLSYICQGRFPQYSGYFFDDIYSAYNTYYPQFILIDY